jgi:flagellar biosynthesis protein FlhG
MNSTTYQPSNTDAVPEEVSPPIKTLAPRKQGPNTPVTMSSAPGETRDHFYAAPVDQASRLRQIVTSFQQDFVLPTGVRRPVPSVQKFDLGEKPIRIRRVPVLAITSGKGGVGKTTLAVNVAAALAQRHIRVTLVDADLGLANADVLCGMTPSRRLESVIEIGGQKRSLRQIAIDAPGGFKLVPGSVGVARMANLPASERSALLDAVLDLEETSDLVMFDTGAGLSESVLSFARFSDLAVVVVTPEPTSIADAYATIKLLRQPTRNQDAHAGKVGIVVNQATTEEEARRTYQRIANTCATFLHFTPDCLGYLNRDDLAPESVKARAPAILRAPQSVLAGQMRLAACKIAREAGIKLVEPEVVKKRGLWARLFEGE